MRLVTKPIAASVFAFVLCQSTLAQRPPAGARPMPPAPAAQAPGRLSGLVPREVRITCPLYFRLKAHDSAIANAE